MKALVHAVCLLVALMALPASATTYVVDVNGGEDFSAIRPAVQAAADGDTVVVNPGTYTGADNRDIVIGGKNIVVKSLGAASDVVIDCQGAGRAFYIWGAAVDSSTVIRRFTITHGWARAMDEDGAGAILCEEASPVIEDCFFVENEGNYAGAIKDLYGHSTIRTCVFVGNDAVCGGAIHSSYASPTISRCVFIENTATAYGGAFRAYAGSPRFTNCTFAQNSCAGECLEFAGTGGAATVDRCIIAFNSQGVPLSGTGVTTAHSIVFANVGGDSLSGAHHDNAFVDPLFCDVGDRDFTVCADSPALADNNTWGEHVGMEYEGCPSCGSPVAASSWGAIKALFRD